MSLDYVALPFSSGPEKACAVRAREFTQEETLQQKVEFWQAKIGMNEWTFWSEFIEPDADSQAKVTYDPYHFQGTVHLNNDLPEDQWDWVVVHELLEVLLEPCKCFVDEVLMHTEPRERAVLDARTESIFEPVLNRLARGIVGRSRPRMD